MSFLDTISMKKLAQALLLLMPLLLAVACDKGSSNNTGILTVRGSLDFGGANRMSPDTDTFKVKATDLITGKVWEKTFVGRYFEIQVIRQTALIVEISYEGGVTLSGYIPLKDSEGALVDKKFNSMTHVRAGLATRFMLKEGLNANAAFAKANQYMFGRDEISQDETTIEKVAELCPDKEFAFPAICHTIDYLVSDYRSEDSRKALQVAMQAFDNAVNHRQILEMYIIRTNKVPDAQQGIANKIADAHKAAKANGLIPVEYFETVDQRFFSTSILRAMDWLKEVPYYPDPIDEVRHVGMGTLFHYTFPRAVTGDPLGISHYDGAFTDTTPKGHFRVNFGKENITIYFTPTRFDLGKKTIYVLAAVGGNEKIGTNAVEINIKNSNFDFDSFISFNEAPYGGHFQPLVGPVEFYNEEFFAFIMESTGPTRVLDLYEQEQFRKQSVSQVTRSVSIELPSTMGNVLKMQTAGQHIFLMCDDGSLYMYRYHFERLDKQSAVMQLPLIDMEYDPPYLFGLTTDAVYALGGDSSMYLPPRRLEEFDDWVRENSPTSIDAYSGDMICLTSSARAAFFKYDLDNDLIQYTTTVEAHSEILHFHEDIHLTSSIAVFLHNTTSVTMMDWNGQYFLREDMYGTSTLRGDFTDTFSYHCFQFTTEGHAEAVMLRERPETLFVEGQKDSTKYHYPRFGERLEGWVDYLRESVHEVHFNEVDYYLSGAYYYVIGQKASNLSPTASNSWRIKRYKIWAKHTVPGDLIY